MLNSCGEEHSVFQMLWIILFCFDKIFVPLLEGSSEVISEMKMFAIEMMYRLYALVEMAAAPSRLFFCNTTF